MTVEVLLGAAEVVLAALELPHDHVLDVRRRHEQAGLVARCVEAEGAYGSRERHESGAHAEVELGLLAVVLHHELETKPVEACAFTVEECKPFVASAIWRASSSVQSRSSNGRVPAERAHAGMHAGGAEMVSLGSGRGAGGQRASAGSSITRS